MPAPPALPATVQLHGTLRRTTRAAVEFAVTHPQPPETPAAAVGRSFWFPQRVCSMRHRHGRDVLTVPAPLLDRKLRELAQPRPQPVSPAVAPWWIEQENDAEAGVA